MRVWPYACQHVAGLYIKHGLSIATCSVGGAGVVRCGNKQPGLMNMLEGLNTFVSVIHPSVLTCNGYSVTVSAEGHGLGRMSGCPTTG